MLNLEDIKKQSGLREDELALLEDRANEEFPEDPAMAELHLARVLLAVKKGWVKREVVMREVELSGTARGI